MTESLFEFLRRLVYFVRPQPPQGVSAVGRTTRKADNGAGFHPATRSIFPFRRRVETGSLFDALRQRPLLCWLGRHRLVPYDPNWPLMTCVFCGREMK